MKDTVRRRQADRSPLKAVPQPGGGASVVSAFQRLADRSPQVQQAVAYQALADRFIPGSSAETMSAPIVQARKVRGASQIGRSAPAIHTWDTKDGNTITLHDVEAGMGADRTWKLQLSASEGDDLGHIFIYYYAAQRELKPDGLEVPRTKQGFGYGAVLGKTAVAAMKLEALRGLTGDAKTVFLNLVNPLSAHISSIKELNLNLNGGDPQDADAASDAATAVGTTTLDTKLYDKTRFPSFWGRLVYLAKNNGVIFEHASFPGARGNAETDFSRQAAEGMLDAVLRAKAGTFGMNIRAPLPDF